MSTRAVFEQIPAPEPEYSDNTHWQSIVDGLRRAGWSRCEAMSEADERVARIQEERRKRLT